jgi:hypothetical protein
MNQVHGAWPAGLKPVHESTMDSSHRRWRSRSWAALVTGAHCGSLKRERANRGTSPHAANGGVMTSLGQRRGGMAAGGRSSSGVTVEDQREN